jgi:hypothetical protein
MSDVVMYVWAEDLVEAVRLFEGAITYKRDFDA